MYELLFNVILHCLSNINERFVCQ